MQYKYEVTLSINGLMSTVSYTPVNRDDDWVEAWHYARSIAERDNPGAKISVLYVQEYDEYDDEPRTHHIQDIPLDPYDRDWYYDGDGTRRLKGEFD